jgi:hypothetical protein
VTPVLTLCGTTNESVAKGAIPVDGKLQNSVSGTTMRALRRVNVKNHGRDNNGTYIELAGAKCR